MTRRVGRWAAVGVVVALLGGITSALGQGGADGPNGDPSSAPAAEPEDSADLADLGLPSLEGLLGDVVDLEELLGLGGIRRWQVPGGIRVLLVSSGVDLATFGDAYTPQFTLPDGPSDKLGLGTYAASVLLQLAPRAHVTAFDIYQDDQVSAARVARALRFAREHAGDFDSVVLAFPPAEVLDPVSQGMTSGDWDRMTVVGTPESRRLGELSEAWQGMRDDVAGLMTAGVTVVASAGDAGPGPQSVLGLAGLPEVVTVGAFDGKGVARVSASGPSVHGRSKPDLVAPTGLPGLVPEKSALGTVLGWVGGLSRKLNLELPTPPAGGRRVALGSTVPAAALVAAAVAQLKVDGVADPAAVRGVLTAAADPLPRLPVWRQGAGALRAMPTADVARSRPLVVGLADLGAEPADTGRAWTAEVPVLGGRVTEAPSSSFPWRIETTAEGGRKPVTTADHTVQPAPTVEATEGGLRVALLPGDNPWAPGAWCGYLHVPLAGLADVIEDVPTCLVEGLALTAFNFYIHDLPAENQTFALIPALPPGAGLLDGPLMVLPVDPLHEPVYAGVSGPDGLVHFRHVPPAFFIMRQFSDYGAPVAEGDRQRDLGEEASYLSYEALVLPNPCPERIQDHQATGTPCHRQWLEERFGDSSVGYDRTTTRYLVDTPAGQVGIVFDFTKKFAGVGVSSRYVDLLTHGALEHGSAVSLDELAAVGLEKAWSFSPASALGDEEGTLAFYKGLDTKHDPTSLAGASRYPFSLTTPNYKGAMALNFGYDLDGAVLGVVVQVADEVHAAVITPQGTVELPPLGGDHVSGTAVEQVLAELQKTKLPAEGVDLLGPARGQASFDFDIKPGGADKGMLTFLYVPINPLSPARVHVGDLSFEITTWQRIDWPPGEFDRDGHPVHGHAFQFSSNYQARQMDHPACRPAGCENWQVFVHSPVDDAETYELIDLAGGQGFLAEVRDAGGGFHHPHRGVHGARHDLELAGLTLPLGRGVVTNGRFWEQLVVPTAALAAHPGPVEVRLEDNRTGGQSALLPHADGPVPLAPYLRFSPWHKKGDTGLAPLPALPEVGVPPAVAPKTVPPVANRLVPPQPVLPKAPPVPRAPSVQKAPVAKAPPAPKAPPARDPARLLRKTLGLRALPARR